MVPVVTGLLMVGIFTINKSPNETINALIDINTRCKENWQF